MINTIGFILLLLAAGTAQRLDERHHPIRLLFWWALLANFGVYQKLPDLVLCAFAASIPAAVVAACWAACHARLRSHLVVMFVAMLTVSTAVARFTDGTDQLGVAMACLSIGGAMAGAAAFYRSDAAKTSKIVLILLLCGLACESVGWISWGNGSEAGYRYACAITRVNWLVIAIVQASERATGRLPWAILFGSDEHISKTPPA